MPGFDVDDRRTTRSIPNPFWGGVLFPLLVFGVPLRLADDRAAASPATASSTTSSTAPATTPWRTAVGAAVVQLGVAIVFLAGSADRVSVSFGVPYTSQIWIYRAGLFVVPPLVFVVTRRDLLRAQGRGQWTEVEPMQTARRVGSRVFRLRTTGTRSAMNVIAITGASAGVGRATARRSRARAPASG